jgi:hypothetical protein
VLGRHLKLGAGKRTSGIVTSPFAAVIGNSADWFRPPRAVEEDPAADRLHAILEADQAGAAGEVGTASAVVADRDAQDLAGDLDLDADG